MVLSFLIQQLSSYNYLTYNMESILLSLLLERFLTLVVGLTPRVEEDCLSQTLSHSSTARVGVVGQTSLLYFKTIREVIF